MHPVSESRQECTLLGWQEPMLWTQAQSFQPTFAALPRVWDKFHNIHSSSKASPWLAGFAGHPCRWWHGHGVLAIGTASALPGLQCCWHGSWDSRWSWGLAVCTTCTLHTTLWDHLSSWFLWIDLILPEAGKKTDWIFPARLRTPKTKELRSFWGPFTTMALSGSQGWSAFL